MTAGRHDLAFGGDDLGARADDNVDTRLHVRIAGLADVADTAIADADIGLDDAPVIEDHGVGDYRIDRARLRGWLCDWPMPSRITLPPPNFTSSPYDGAILFDTDEEFRVSQPDAVPDGGTVHARRTRAD